MITSCSQQPDCGTSIWKLLNGDREGKGSLCLTFKSLLSNKSSNSYYEQIKFIPEKETKINKVDNAKEQLIKRSQPLLSGDDGSGEDDCGAVNGKAVGLWVS
jgi:hypothetical protein